MLSSAALVTKIISFGMYSELLDLKQSHKAALHAKTSFKAAHKRDTHRDVVPVHRQAIARNSKETLLENWCVAVDKQASGWSHLSDKECMQSFLDTRENAVTAIKRSTSSNSASSSAILLFKHVHKAGGTTLCQVAQRNMVAEDVALPSRADWTTNCVPYESFLGPHPAVGNGFAALTGDNNNFRRKLQGTWLGGACFLGFLTPAQLRVLPQHYSPLTFVASEGPLPDAIPLDAPFAMTIMVRHPLDRVLSSYRWWQFMLSAMPHSPAECRAYWAPSNATIQQWLRRYPDNWMTRELAGTSALYKRDAKGRPAPLTAGEVEKAKQRLHYFAAVLIMEEMETSQALLKGRFGWKDVDLMGHRAGSVRNSSAEVELATQPEVLKQLREANIYDLEIYEYAVKLHEEQVRTMQAESKSTRVS